MALVRVDFISESLKRPVEFTAILPLDKLGWPGAPKPERKPLKTLYLLHGILGDHQDWVSGTRVQRWAQERDLAVVMPSGENGFYLDHPGRGDLQYGEFIGRELVAFTRDLFPLSRRREDTFIAGLSMGGFGALRNGLRYADAFGAIGAFSSALVLESAVSSDESSPLFMGQRSYYESVFGDLSTLLGSDKDPSALLRGLVARGEPVPALYVSCGTEDFLLPASRAFRELAASLGVPATYVEGPGGHDWDFWDAHIKRFIDWLPLAADAASGMDSGHVGRTDED